MFTGRQVEGYLARSGAGDGRAEDERDVGFDAQDGAAGLGRAAEADGGDESFAEAEVLEAERFVRELPVQRARGDVAAETNHVLDEERDLYMRLNKELVSLEAVSEKYDIAELRTMIEQHAAATGSPKAKRILADFEQYVPLFKKVIPHDYAAIRAAVSAFEEKGMTGEQAEIEAFYAVTSAKRREG